MVSKRVINHKYSRTYNAIHFKLLAKFAIAFHCFDRRYQGSCQHLKTAIIIEITFGIGITDFQIKLITIHC